VLALPAVCSAAVMGHEELEREVQHLRQQLASAEAECGRLAKLAREAVGQAPCREPAVGQVAAAARALVAGEAVAETAGAVADGADAGELAAASVAGALGPYSPAFQRATAGLFDPHMGVENMGPLLYALVRFTKPKRLLEVGAGYTSVWVLQALADNEQELEKVRQMGSVSPVCGVPWFVQAAFEDAGVGKLYCVDNLTHTHTTAHRVAACAEELGIARHLEVHSANAFDIFDTSTDIGQALGSLHWDLLWFDGISACAEWPAFFRQAWARLNDRGLALVHSSLTNTATRSWLCSTREEAETTGPWVSMEVATADGYKGTLHELVAKVRTALPDHVWRMQQALPRHVQQDQDQTGKLVLEASLTAGGDAFEEGVALADDVLGVEGVGYVGNVLPARRWMDGMHHVGLLEPHKRMQNSVSLLQKRAAGGDLSEPTFSYLP